MKKKWNLSVAVTIMAICLITTAAHAQRSTGPLVLRFSVPFSFTVTDTTFPAGEYEVRQPTQFILTLRNVENQASAMEQVEPAASIADGRAKTVFHRYEGAYFLAAISDGSWQSTYDFRRSNKEKELIVKNRMRQPEVVSVLSKPSPVTADLG
jgi:hypothetical protein